MSGDKISVKELAGMFGLEAAAMKTELQAMGFEVKMVTSSIPVAEIEKIKARFKEEKGAVPEETASHDEPENHKDESGEEPQVERREVQPGLIIRRRRVKDVEKTEKELAAAEPDKPEGLEAQPVAVEKEQKEAKVEDEKPEKPVKKETRPRETPAARIISKPQPEPAPQEENEPEDKIEHKKEAARHIARPDATFEPDEEDIKVSKAAVASALKGPETAEEAQSGPSEKREQKANASPHVRIISRPDPVPNLLEPKLEPQEEQPLSKSSGGPRHQDPTTKKYEAERDGPKKKRSSGSRRTVDFSDFGDEPLLDLDKTDINADWGDTASAAGRPQNRRRYKPRKEARADNQANTQPIKAAKRKIKIDEFIKVGDLAHEMGVKSTEVIKILMQFGSLATINQALDIDTATLVAAEFDYEIEKTGFSEDTYLTDTAENNPEDLKPRPPVVTIMGHVDHGKTSLLDAIRKSAIAQGEAGGITQHIGAYHVTTPKGDIVFLDTPGHEAFTAMRARGAQVTDLVVLVVAADDGVMEQTREAVNHSQAAGVPIMVAVNKMDKESADPERVTRELSELGLVSEDWGGDTIFVKVSAKSRQGIDELLEMIALQAEVLELKANPDKAARGHIVEAKLDKGRGPVATVLIQEGTLHQGDVFVCGIYSGRVRAMLDDQGRKIKSAGPSIPVEVHGFEGVPEAGEEFISVADEKIARRIVDERAIRQREKELARESRVTLETFLASRPTDQETLILNLVMKTDVQGSLEAISEALQKLGTEEVRVNLVHGAAGSITESDVLLASASNAIIIGFNVRPTSKVKELAEQEKVEIRFYDIIYNLADDIKKAMEGLLAPVVTEVYLGQVEVRETFSVPKMGTIAGCFVVDGKITRTAEIRLLREGVVIYTGKVNSLKRFKDDVKDVVKGYECGLSLENYNDIKVGDIVEAFERQEQAATLS